MYFVWFLCGFAAKGQDNALHIQRAHFESSSHLTISINAT
jgi:hypothetical protein